MTLSVFVYGTLKPGGRYYQRYCGVHSPRATPAAVRGKLYDFPHLGYPAITAGDQWVKGYLFEFFQSTAVCHDILRRLDELEGYQGEDSVDNEYDREQVEIFSLDHCFLRRAWVYKMSFDLVSAMRGVWVYSGDWLED